MVHAKIRAQYGRIWVEIDCADVKEAMKGLSMYGEVFAETTCGRCNSVNILPEHRTDDEGHDYYSLKCNDCGAELSFGQHKVGNTLFPKKKDLNGEFDGQYHGWYFWKEREERRQQEQGSGF